MKKKNFIYWIETPNGHKTYIQSELADIVLGANGMHQWLINADKLGFKHGVV